jgi:hypothetical protein
MSSKLVIFKDVQQQATIKLPLLWVGTYQARQFVPQALVALDMKMDTKPLVADLIKAYATADIHNELGSSVPFVSNPNVSDFTVEAYAIVIQIDPDAAKAMNIVPVFSVCYQGLFYQQAITAIRTGQKSNACTGDNFLSGCFAHSSELHGIESTDTEHSIAMDGFRVCEQHVHGDDTQEGTVVFGGHDGFFGISWDDMERMNPCGLFLTVDNASKKAIVTWIVLHTNDLPNTYDGVVQCVCKAVKQHSTSWSEVLSDNTRRLLMMSLEQKVTSKHTSTSFAHFTLPPGVSCAFNACVFPGSKQNVVTVVEAEQKSNVVFKLNDGTVLRPMAFYFGRFTQFQNGVAGAPVNVCPRGILVYGQAILEGKFDSMPTDEEDINNMLLKFMTVARDNTSKSSIGDIQTSPSEIMMSRDCDKLFKDLQLVTFESKDDQHAFVGDSLWKRMNDNEAGFLAGDFVYPHQDGTFLVEFLKKNASTGVIITVTDAGYTAGICCATDGTFWVTDSHGQNLSQWIGQKYNMQGVSVTRFTTENDAARFLLSVLEGDSMDAIRAVEPGSIGTTYDEEEFKRQERVEHVTLLNVIRLKAAPQ